MLISIIAIQRFPFPSCVLVIVRVWQRTAWALVGNLCSEILRSLGMRELEDYIYVEAEEQTGRPRRK